MKKTLLIGASTNEERYAYKATVMLKEYGHEVYAYGIKPGFIENTVIETVWPEKSDFDTVTLYIGNQHQEVFFNKIIELKPKRVLFNPGTENAAFETMLKENGIEPLEACTLVLLRTGQF
jgi:uncharacterized protein